MSKNFDSIDESLDITPSEVFNRGKPVVKKKPVREENQISIETMNIQEDTCIL